jgi:hypothetical protein
MLPLPRIQFLSVAAAGVLVTLAASSISVRADELAQNLGPVGPYEPILTAVGSKRVIAFYVPDSGHCTVDAVVWDNVDAGGLIAKFWPHTAYSAARVRISLDPGQIVRIDSAEDEGLNLQCGDKAATLAVVGTSRTQLRKAGNTAGRVVVGR